MRLKQIAVGVVQCALLATVIAIPVQAAGTLEDVLAGGSGTVNKSTTTIVTDNEGNTQTTRVDESTTVTPDPTPQPANQDQTNNQGQTNNSQTITGQNGIPQYNGIGQDYIDDNLRGNDLTKNPNQTAQSVNKGIYEIAQVLTQIIAYALTIMLTLRTLIDLTYIAIPFTRGFLANGFGGSAQAGGGAAGNMARGGMGMSRYGGGYGGMGMSSYGGGYGGYGGNRMGGMAGNPGMANQQGTMTGRIQWVSDAALNAVAAGTSVDQNGKAVSPFKQYAKDMAVTLVAVPILLVLALTGAMTDLGFVIGKAIAAALGKLGGMI